MQACVRWEHNEQPHRQSFGKILIYANKMQKKLRWKETARECKEMCQRRLSFRSRIRERTKKRKSIKAKVQSQSIFDDKKMCSHEITPTA